MSEDTEDREHAERIALLLREMTVLVIKRAKDNRIGPADVVFVSAMLVRTVIRTHSISKATAEQIISAVLSKEALQ